MNLGPSNDINTTKPKNVINLDELHSYEIHEIELKEIGFDFFTQHASLPDHSQKIIDSAEIINLSHSKNEPNSTNQVFQNTMKKNDLFTIDPNFSALPLGQGKLFVNIATPSENKSIQDQIIDFEIDDLATQILLMEVSLYAERKAKGEIEGHAGNKLKLVNIEILEDGSQEIKASSKKDKLLLERMRQRAESISIKNSDGSESSITLKNASILKMNKQEYHRYHQLFSTILDDLKLTYEKNRHSEKDTGTSSLANRAIKIVEGSNFKGNHKEKADFIAFALEKIIKNHLHQLAVDNEKDKKIREEKEEEFRKEMKKNYQIADLKKEELKALATNENIASINSKKISLIKGKHK